MRDTSRDHLYRISVDQHRIWIGPCPVGRTVEEPGRGVRWTRDNIVSPELYFSELLAAEDLARTMGYAIVSTPGIGRVAVAPSEEYFTALQGLPAIGHGRECDETECDKPATHRDTEGYAWCAEHAE